MLVVPLSLSHPDILSNLISKTVQQSFVHAEFLSRAFDQGFDGGA
jgi:hypothetical protein